MQKGLHRQKKHHSPTWHSCSSTNFYDSPEWPLSPPGAAAALSAALRPAQSSSATSLMPPGPGAARYPAQALYSQAAAEAECVNCEQGDPAPETRPRYVQPEVQHFRAPIWWVVGLVPISRQLMCSVKTCYCCMCQLSPEGADQGRCSRRHMHCLRWQIGEADVLAEHVEIAPLLLLPLLHAGLRGESCRGASLQRLLQRRRGHWRKGTRGQPRRGDHSLHRQCEAEESGGAHQFSEPLPRPGVFGEIIPA